MRKAIIIIFLATIAVTAWAGTEYRDACRKIIYAVNPVDEVAKVENDRLRALTRYALGIAVEGQDALNENDALMFAFLGRVDMKRRQVTANELSLYLQEEKEKLSPYIKGKGDVTIYIKMDNWIDMYQLRLITG
jgi:hypothetical protein